MPSKYDYHLTITHAGLGKVQTVEGHTYGEAKLRAEQLQQKWEAEYERKVEAQKGLRPNVKQKSTMPKWPPSPSGELIALPGLRRASSLSSGPSARVTLG